MGGPNCVLASVPTIVLVRLRAMRPRQQSGVVAQLVRGRSQSSVLPPFVLHARSGWTITPSRFNRHQSVFAGATRVGNNPKNGASHCKHGNRAAKFLRRFSKPRLFKPLFHAAFSLMPALSNNLDARKIRKSFHRQNATENR